MKVTIPTNMWAAILLRAVETDKKYPWIHQVEFYLNSCIAVSDNYTEIDLAQAEHAEPILH